MAADASTIQRLRAACRGCHLLTHDACGVHSLHYSLGDGSIGSKEHSRELMEFREWSALLTELGLIDEVFTAREAALTFTCCAPSSPAAHLTPCLALSTGGHPPIFSYCSFRFTARMRCVDVQAAESRVRLTQLGFEDYLEAIVRCATIKVLPSDEDVYTCA